MPNWSIFNRSDGDGVPGVDDWGQRYSEVLASDTAHYDPFRTAQARRYWRVQAINSHIVNTLGAAELRADEGGGESILRVFENSSEHLLPQWGADLQIDGNAFGRLEFAGGRGADPFGAALVRYVAPQAISVMIWDGQLVGYELTPRFNGEQAYTTAPVLVRPFSGAPNQFPPEEIIHLKNGLDPRFGELLGDNKLRDVLDMVRFDAQLTRYSLDVVRNVASNSFILQPAARDEMGIRIEELRRVASRLRAALTSVARGGIALLPGRVEAINVGKNPRDLQFADLHKDPESAIASAFK